MAIRYNTASTAKQAANIPSAVINNVEKSNQNSAVFAQYRSIGAYRNSRKLMARDMKIPGISCLPVIFFLTVFLLTLILPVTLLHFFLTIILSSGRNHGIHIRSIPRLYILLHMIVIQERIP